MVEKDVKIKGSKVLVLGITFKENCPDIRNTKAVDLIQSLMDYGSDVTVFDPWASAEEVSHEYSLNITNSLPKDHFHAVVLAVAHKEFLGLDLRTLLETNGIIYDVKGVLEYEIDARL